MTYNQVVLTQRGGPEVLKIQSSSIRNPENQEVQIRVLACGVGRTDVAMRYGYYPFAPKIPFVPGYEIVGEVEAIGPDVNDFQIGDRVAALTVYGGYSEKIYLHQEHLVNVPDGIQADKAVAVILNYTTAYQILTRVAGVKPGNCILIIGASGGVGTALLDLGRMMGLTMYGTASPSKHALLDSFGAAPINYKQANWMTHTKRMVPSGFDYVLDGIGEAYIPKGFKLLKRGGKLVSYGYPDFKGLLKGIWNILKYHYWPNGKSGSNYGISGNYRKDKSPILEDMKTLLGFLKEGKIDPVIHSKFSILDAAKANQSLEEGSALGKIVLLAPELLSK